ncbi:(2,3-dihydroxybenzoyl)adenylate synthase [Herbidospora mongoliensis]|uniref:(2,3-dihydroxybenzoyl)adenylate synthase n=1 Tax=Herbidospora mongoliensis TaxID=688067 RepID=UPI0008343774|nr:AMP-binding protein [Herbidospora mongoliensis]
MLPGCTPWPEDLAAYYRSQHVWQGVSLGDLPAAWAAQYGDATALVWREERISYRDLAIRVARTAAGFARHGIEPGDRVVLQLPNTPDFVVVAFAMFKAGVKAVFSLASHRSNEVGHLSDTAGAIGYIGPNHDIAHSLRIKHVLSPEDLDATPITHPEVDPSDVAFFLLSGGTTALPKLIPRTHDDYAYQTRIVADLCRVTSDDVYLAALPVEFNFTWGCPGVIGTLHKGGTVVLADDPGADECFALITREKVTVTSVVPTVAHLWLEAREYLDDDLSTLRLMQIGGARLQPELAARIEPELGCRLQQVFGMAEGLLSMSRLDDPVERVIATQGQPVSPYDEIRIIDGELLTRGPYTLRGYYNAPQHNAKAFTPDGFYKTGDLASVTADGDLVIEGRIKDVVIRGGDKIAAGEVEGHLLTHPDVDRAAVVPVPDEFLGERIYAFLVSRRVRPSLTDLKRALHERGLADFKLPDRIEFVDAFPLTPLGKVDKKTLAAAAADPTMGRDWKEEA